MDTTSAPANSTAQPPTRGLGRGEARQSQRGRGDRQGGPRGRGRGGRGGRGDYSRGGSNRGSGRPQDGTNAQTQSKETSAAENAAPQNGQTELQGGDQNEEGSEAELCFICASPVQHTAVTPCNHRTCHICSLRLRALYKTKTCAHCRTIADFVIFTDHHEKNFEDFANGDIFKTDNNFGIRFENNETYEDTVLLLRFNCPDSTCDVACLSWPDLYRHVKTVHQRVMCELCTRNKKVFTHEHELFTFGELKKHQKFGDDNPGAVDQSGFKGHPECGFCKQRFYGDDELYTHCRDRHERCHICDRRDGGRQPQYYLDYNALEQHFRESHLLCPDQECLDKKFVVFDSEIDLKAHQLEAHPNGLSKDARRDARRIDLSGFQVRAPPEAGRGRGRGRGRDPNSEPPLPSTTGPLRRDELAYQRQMAIQNAQSSTGRAFGGQLTNPETYAARPPPRASPPSTITARTPENVNSAPITNGMGALSLGAGNERPPTNPTPQEQARLLRHNAVTERASNLLRTDLAKMAEFRSKVSAYKNSSISAAELVEDFFSLFDSNTAELGKLIKELADIFEVQTKREDLLKAWNDWKAINEDYPSLPGVAAGSSAAAVAAAHGGSRVLKLKSSTAQSSRSAVNRKASWASTSGSNTLFPALPPSTSSRVGAKPGQTPWAGPSAAASSRNSPLPSRSSSSTALNKKPITNSADAFPALPPAAKPTTTLFTPGYSGGVTRRINQGAPRANAWGGGNTSLDQSAAATGDAEEETNEGGRKKKGKKKQTLFHFG